MDTLTRAQEARRDKNLLEPFLSSSKPIRTESKTCSDCGKVFEAKVWNVQGREVSAVLCKDCDLRHESERLKTERQAEAAEIEKTNRDHWLRNYGVIGNFRGKTFDNFESSHQPRAYRAVKSLSGSLVLLSTPGVYGLGKTHLVSALANELVKTAPAVGFNKAGYPYSLSCPVFFTTEYNMLARIRATYDHQGETEGQVYMSLLRPDLLIIDDVGKLRPHDLTFIQSVYFRLLDERYVMGKRVILTTNLEASALDEYIGGACSDRLLEMCGKKGIIKMTGTSYRQGVGK
jgi:DNA replication protein DnaC